MAVKIKLMRMGKIRAPYYRIVVADARTKRDGRFIEAIGKYHPTEEPSLIEVDGERAQYWLGVGAQPTEPVRAIFSKTGDWQRFKGLPYEEGTLKVAAPRADKKAAFDAAAREVGSGETVGAATTPRARKSAEAAPAPVEAPAAAEAPVEAPAVTEAPVEAPAAAEAPVEAPVAEAPVAEAPAAEAPAETPEA